MNRLPFALTIITLLSATPAVSNNVVGGEENVQKSRALPAPVDRAVEFRRDVAPLFKRRCTRCHGAKKAEGGLRLDVAKRALEGGDRGALLVPGKSAESLLVLVLTGLNDEELVMPPSGKPFTDEQVGIIRAWIDQGANWPANEANTEPSKSDHWSFRPIVRPEPPRVKQSSWVRNPIDSFVLAKLETKSIAPAPEADRGTLIRRLYLDVVGLPPPITEVDAFVNDERPHAYERLVDRLLSSPRFGERWGRHWLDLARYADSNGYEDDKYRPDAWRYRDWVVSSYNNDQPYDTFTVDQLAGDRRADATYEAKAATGFHRMTPSNEAGNPAVEEEYRVKTAKDRLNTTGTVWLGLTVGCAQCHSHKYDPLTQREYYQLYAFFNSTIEINVDAPRLPEKYYEAYRKAKKEFKGHINNTPEPPSAVALTVAEGLDFRQTFVHVRGDFLQKGVNVAPKTPAFLPPIKVRERPQGEARADRIPVVRDVDRLDLAHWIVDPQHPLPARVEVNRLWRHLFGHALVRTPEDFGVQGEPPTHPQLVDWLAAEFMERGWQRKATIKLIVSSATYRQSANARPEIEERDPQNRLVARQNRFPVEAEVVRDLSLSASGLLVLALGGPSVQPPLPAGLTEQVILKDERFREEDEGDERFRRGVYTNVQRTFPYPSLLAFDSADANVCSTRRDRSMTPLQALTLLNERAFFECAQNLGHELARTMLSQAVTTNVGASDGGVNGSAIRKCIKGAIHRCLSRSPTSTEIDILVRLFHQHRAIYNSAPDAAAKMAGSDAVPDGIHATDVAAWVGVARTILNLEEFITRE